ncbi:hypothetical protein DFH27DRAFT_558511, partial [Peziza echinospora]
MGGLRLGGVWVVLDMFFLFFYLFINFFFFLLFGLVSGSGVAYVVIVFFLFFWRLVAHCSRFKYPLTTKHLCCIYSNRLHILDLAVIFDQAAMA